VRPRLLRRICLLYCNQTIRNLFISHDNSATAVLSNVLLAVAMATALIIICSDKSDTNTEMRKMLDSLLYLYGDVLDFMFDYGIFKVTVAAFGASIFLTTIQPPTHLISEFIWNLATIVSTNLLIQGIDTVITSVLQLEFLECLLTSLIIQMILPRMQGYILYLSAQRLLILFPNMSCLFFCAIVFTELLPDKGKQWVGDLLAIYIVSDVTTRIAEIHVWGVLIILILAHYIEHIVTNQHT
jgi:hypothetical protein